MRPPLIRLKLQPSDARRERAGELLPKGSLHEPDDPEADGQTEYRGGNCKTDLFAHESLEPVSDKLKSRTVHEGRHEKLCRRGRPPG
jgi:hypothetical protein